MLKTLPNALTVARVLMIPAIMATFYLPGPEARWIAAGLFVIAALTDYLDGWLARALKVVSDFGRLLDPIADKLLVAAVLLMLAGFDRLSALSLVAAVVILFRELLVSGLREFLAERGIAMPVTTLAKWKTATQLVALPLLLLGDTARVAGLSMQVPGEVLLWIAAALTAQTGYVYLRQGLAHMGGTETETETETDPTTKDPA
ncbi:CDP-diacylglycerol--glycerol-3-phosphate 3-phosphatidyltransferase [Roseospira goensis]|uniref:CDP-diacylglycerol--glycerol-3-phosphate 3-phosphatidyltransferase n=1 Tax=Roseospira goensis TaxID=391922 RepID=A0A7W6S2X9_9PROT|nr:CDP-diacylglycerol--glycerol-3-phosphate 3-phosphatidyltransferase [Roseospira goensis]MBB4287425.1 cardiolipin synthase [Roseospira goensis]